MPELTENLKLVKPLETEVFDIDVLNGNMDIVDRLHVATDYGTATATYSGANSGSGTNTATWHYKKYTNKTIECSTCLSVTDLMCSSGSESPYYSGYVTVNFPFSFASIFDVQMHLASNRMGWVNNITSGAITTQLKFRIIGIYKETSPVAANVYISLKGVSA